MEQAYEGRDPYIFVSYAHKDSEVAIPIIEALQRAGYRVWYDVGIKTGYEWKEYVAAHVESCCCMLALLTRASVRSKHCKREMDYADSLNKKMLFVHLEEVELTSGMRMYYDPIQHAYRSRYATNKGFIAELLETEILRPCLYEDAAERRRKRRPEVEELVGEAKALLDSYSTDIGRLQLALRGLCALRGDERDSKIEQLIWRLKERVNLHEHMVGGSVRQASPVTGRERNASHKAGGQQDNKKVNVAEAHDALVVGGRRSVERGKAETQSLPNDAATIPVKNLYSSGSSDLTRDLLDKHVQARMPKRPAINVPVKSLIEYNWDELKCVADIIAAAGTEGEWREIAKCYRLLGHDDKLHGDTIPLKLADGTLTSIRIAGFQHDELADCSGRKAGITFEFSDVPAVHQMNPGWTNAGGWDKSEMRRWLNGDFRKLLPLALDSNIVQVKKCTNNRGADVDNDVGAVTETTDALWVCSMSEVYGRLSSQSKNVPACLAVYDAEGTQYQLYADQKVSTANYGFCVKQMGGADSWWWLRSPSAGYSGRFRGVSSRGDWGYNIADSARGVSPGFCF